MTYSNNDSQGPNRDAHIAELLRRRQQIDAELAELHGDDSPAADNKALWKSEEQFRLLVESVQEYAIFMLDAEGHVVSWNAGAERMKGYSPEEILGRSVAVFYTPEDVALGLHKKELADAARAGHHEVEGWRVRQDGSRFLADVVTTALYSPDGTIRGYSKVVRDITECKQAEEALRVSESRSRTLAAVVEKSNDFIGISTPELQPIYVNEAGRRMVGLDSMDEVKRTHVLDYFWPENLPRIQQEAIPALQRDGRWVGDVRFRHFKTGAPIYTRWSVVTIRDEAGKAIAYATVSPDLTQLKEAEEAQRESEERLQLALESGQMGMFEWDVRIDQSVWNGKEYELLGLPPGESHRPTDSFSDMCIRRMRRHYNVPWHR